MTDATIVNGFIRAIGAPANPGAEIVAVSYRNEQVTFTTAILDELKRDQSIAYIYAKSTGEILHDNRR